jgi:hypothetical protein
MTHLIHAARRITLSDLVGALAVFVIWVPVYLGG